MDPILLYHKIKPPNQRIESPSLFIKNLSSWTNKLKLKPRMESNPQSSGICRRLFRLVLGALRRPPSALPPPTTDQVKNGKNCEIVVELRHTGAAKEGLILSDDQNKRLEYEGREKDEQQGEGRVKKGSVSMNGSERKEVAIHSAAVEDGDDMKPRRHWPLLGVASNINEKSEAFIEKKKKAMNRNYSLDQNHGK